MSMVQAVSTIEGKVTLSTGASFGNFSCVKNLHSEKNVDNIVLNAIPR